MLKYGNWTSPRGTQVYSNLIESMVQTRNGFMIMTTYYKAIEPSSTLLELLLIAQEDTRKQG